MQMYFIFVGSFRDFLEQEQLELEILRYISIVAMRQLNKSSVVCAQ